MAKLYLKDSSVNLSPPCFRHRLTLQNALLSNPAQYFHSTKHPERSRSKKKEPGILEREPPKPLVVSERTQTKDVMDAETNTKTQSLTLQSGKSRLKTTCTRALAKGATLASRSPYVEIVKRLKDINEKQKKSLLAEECTKELAVGNRRRGILKKVLEDMTLEGMCSTGTTTDKKQPSIDGILKENHIFLKYSKSCKSKKKRVRMDRKPAFSYFSKREQESVQSLAEASEEERPNRVGVDENNDNSSDPSDDESLERKPARLALRGSASSDTSDGPDGKPDDGSELSVVSSMASAPQLSATEKLSKRPMQRQVPKLAPLKHSEEPPKKPPCGVPKEKLYLKNMAPMLFSYFPGRPRKIHKR